MASIEHRLVGIPLQTAYGLLGNDRLRSVFGVHFQDRGCPHIAKIEVTFAVGAQRVRKTKIFGNQFPVLSRNEQIEQCQVATKIVTRIDRRNMRLFSPEPLHGFGKLTTTKVRIVRETFSPFEMKVVSHVLEGGRHPLIGNGPTSKCIVDVTTGTRHIDANGFGFRLSNQCWIQIASSQVSETARTGKYTLKLLRHLPSHGKCTNRAGTGTCNRTHLGVFGDRVTLLDFRHDLLHEESRVTIPQAVVFEVTIGRFIFDAWPLQVVPRIDENGNGGWHVTTGDQVVENGWHPPTSLRLHPFTILKDHQGCRLAGVVLSGNINPPVTRGPRENLGAGQRFHTFNFSLRHAISGNRLGVRFPSGVGFGVWNRRGFCLIIPQPFERRRQNFARPSAAVPAVGHFKLVGITGELQGCRHITISEWPIAMQVAEIISPLLKIDLDWLGTRLRFPDQPRIFPSSPDVREAANVAHHLAKLIGAFPSDGKCTDSTRRNSTYRTVNGILGNIKALKSDGEKFLDQKTAVPVAQTVILKGAIASLAPTRNCRFDRPGIHKNGDGHWHRLLVNQVIENNRNSESAFWIRVPRTIHEDHQVCGGLFIVLCRDINAVIAGRPGKYFCLCKSTSRDHALGHFGLHDSCSGVLPNERPHDAQTHGHRKKSIKHIHDHDFSTVRGVQSTTKRRSRL